MTLMKLIESIGQENIRVQYLHETASGAEVRGKRGAKYTEIRFQTRETGPEILLGYGPVCMILWITREKFEAALKANQSTATP